ncbi:MAG: multiubiquitin domain-containing protein [Candidatus Helarchaeota archaeon]|nr:multiubiquitin domain-containing protein [Candidatus Helarchaeota archaeon]
MVLWTVIRYILYVVGTFLIIYLILPLLWKVWARFLDASYKPSKWDQIAQPQPNQIQATVPEVKVDESGSYEIAFGEGRTFSGGTLQIHFQGQWYHAHPSADSSNGAKALRLQSIEKKSDSDEFENCEITSMKWEIEGTSIPIHCNIIIYPNQPIIKFQIKFPEGLKDVSTGKYEDLIFKFPCFNLEAPNRKILGYRDALFCPPIRKIPKKGIHGPVVFYDNDLNSVVFGPMDHFMIAYTKKDGAIFHGLEGKIKEIPETFEHSCLFLLTKGINQAIVQWCGYLHQYHGTEPKDPYADPIVANIGFWTDNGAHYYYRKEKGMNYAQTVQYASEVFKNVGIPFKYYQLDSWWYQKDMKAIWKIPPFSWLGRLIGGGAYGGTILWEVIPEEFPDGLKALHEQIGLPFACHARWFSTKSPYLQKYKSALGKTAGLPMDPQFWNDLMKQSAERGIIMYEQDWLRTTFTRVPHLQEDINAAENWLTWMAEAADRNNISIQYCMASSGTFLYALKLPAITNARVTGDYHARVTKQFFYPHFSQTNIIAWGIGIWPSLDCFLTTKTPLSKGLYREKYPEQMTLLSNLGGGIICPADKAERVNKGLLMKTCTEEGLLLKPDRPITANDLMFKINQKPYIMDTWSQKEDRFWRYIFVVNLWPRRVKDPTLTLRELGYAETGVIYDFFSGEIREIGPDDVIKLKLKRMEHKYFIFVPFLKEGLALIGTPEKFVTCANKLIPKVKTDSSGLDLAIEYSPNSSLKLLIYSRIAPRDVTLTDNSVSVNWDYDTSTQKLELILHFSTSNSTEVSIKFNE